VAKPASALVATTLDEYGAVVRTELERVLAVGEPRRHLYDPAADYPRRGGRMLRPSLCLAATRAFGGDPDDAVLSAVSLELMHNAFLVHDDIEDQSDLRRGEPTLHVKHGVPVAVNVGDGLMVMGLLPLVENHRRLGSHLAMRVMEEALRMARESVEGQAIELGWREDNVLDLVEADYLEMILKKTSWYTILYPLRVGALIGRRDRFDLDRLIRFGFFLGAAFQIQDDLLNLIGDEDRYGKELSGDLFEGKRTVMLIHALQQSGAADRKIVGEILGKPRDDRTAAEVRWLRHLMDGTGSIEHGRELAHGLAGAALHEFERAFDSVPDSRDRRFLEALPTWVLERA
jgi:geranylgeranyl diphosphate synthase type II